MTTEAVLITPVLVMLLLFVAVVCHRGVDARLRLDAAAHQAARAASLERSTSTATAAARQTAGRALAEAGVVCQHAETIVHGVVIPGGTITVTVRCSVSLGQAVLLAVPRNATVQARAREVIDTYRSQMAGRRP